MIVIPAKAGIQYRKGLLLTVFPACNTSNTVIPGEPLGEGRESTGLFYQIYYTFTENERVPTVDSLPSKLKLLAGNDENG